jgi:uncharacterized protein (TIGR03067 family)
MRPALLLFALAATLAIGAAPWPRADDDPEPDPLRRLVGEWSLASTCDENRQTPGSPLLRMVVEKGRVRFLLGQRENNCGTFAAVKPCGKVKGIDLRLKGDGVLHGVYAFDGEALVLCFARQGEPRPAGLAPKGTQWAERWVRAEKR